MGIHKWHQKRHPRRASRKLRKTLANVLRAFMDFGTRAEIRKYVKILTQPTTPTVVGNKRLNHLYVTFNPAMDSIASNPDHSKLVNVRLHRSCYKVNG